MTDAVVTKPKSSKEDSPQVISHKPGHTTTRAGDAVISHGHGPDDPIEAILPHSDRPPTYLGQVAPGETKTVKTPIGSVTIEHKPNTPPQKGTLFVRIKKK